MKSEPPPAETRSDIEIYSHPVEGEPHSSVIVRAIAGLTHQDPTQMRPMYDLIDPELIDRMFETEAAQFPLTLTFEFEGCYIVVEKDHVYAGRLEADAST